MVRLRPRVDHQRAVAAPMLLGDEWLDAVNIRRRIAPRERGPQEVLQRRGGKIALIDDDNQREPIDRCAAVEAIAESGNGAI